MSPLILIKRSMQRTRRLNEAQFLMAKAYRGIPYSSHLNRDSVPETKVSTKTYRGIEYSA
jgi:hypothetical protein